MFESIAGADPTSRTPEAETAAPLALKQRVDVWGDVGPALRVMQALKRQLDPRGTLNRGRFVAHI